ncbi:tetraspanin-6 isoform X2 [Hydra vulgaris]|uniref:Tetraspanin n=1 Tax=Hydra vulgaris TaxID=6087 RepID=A0ABM4B7H2_HYDVU
MSQPLVTFVKGLFLVFNFVFWISGLALLVIGIMAKFAFKYFMKLSSDIDYNLAPYVMIGCGIFIVLIGFCGCWAAIKQHSWVLKLYMFIMVLLVLSEVGGAIAGYILKGKLASGLKEGMMKAVKNYYSNKDLHDAMDEIQAKYVKCCGVNSYQDYFNVSSSTTAPAVTTTSLATNASTTTEATTTVITTGTLYINTTVALPNTTTTAETNSTVGRKRREADTVSEESVPQSCCKNSDGSGCRFKDLKGLKPEEMGIYTQGCYDGLFNIAKKNFGIVGGVAIGIAVFQLLGIVCAYFLTQLFMKTNKYEQM